MDKEQKLQQLVNDKARAEFSGWLNERKGRFVEAALDYQNAKFIDKDIKEHGR